MRVLVMGGTRFLGVQVVEQLLAAGHEVVIFHRGNRVLSWSRPLVEIIGDRTITEDLQQLRGLNLDAVLDMSAYTRAQTETLVSVPDILDVPRLVHVSTVNVYRPSPVLPWPEETPYGPHPLWGGYANDKIGCELALRERRPGTHSTIAIRFPLVLGPGNFIPREEFVLNRLLDDQVILLPGDGQAVHQYVWIQHAARALTRALELEVVGYEAFNVASRRCNTSLEGFVEVCAEVSSTTPKLVTVGGGATGENLPVFNGVDCVFPFSNENTILDLTKAHEAGLLEPVLPLPSMIEASRQYLLAHPARRRWQRTEAEKRVLRRLELGTGS